LISEAYFLFADLADQNTRVDSHYADALGSKVDTTASFRAKCKKIVQAAFLCVTL
jgi:hypothetical protein